MVVQVTCTADVLKKLQGFYKLQNDTDNDQLAKYFIALNLEWTQDTTKQIPVMTNKQAEAYYDALNKKSNFYRDHTEAYKNLRDFSEIVGVGIYPENWKESHEQKLITQNLVDGAVQFSLAIILRGLAIICLPFFQRLSLMSKLAVGVPGIIATEMIAKKYIGNKVDAMMVKGIFQASLMALASYILAASFPVLGAIPFIIEVAGIGVVSSMLLNYRNAKLYGYQIDPITFQYEKLTKDQSWVSYYVEDTLTPICAIRRSWVDFTTLNKSDSSLKL